MLRIIEHIEQMLSVHDCVIIPGFGGFVLQVTPTWYNAEAHRFEPLHKELVFNETLQHNDGLLIESYRQSEATDYRSAYQLVQADVAELKALLERDGQVEMAPIGVFRRGEEGQLIFEASRDTDWLNASMFGLPAFTIEPLAEERSGGRSGDCGVLVRFYVGRGGKPFGLYRQLRAYRDAECQYAEG